MPGISDKIAEQPAANMLTGCVANQFFVKFSLFYGIEKKFPVDVVQLFRERETGDAGDESP